MKRRGLDPAFYANRRRSFDEVLPWDHLDYGIRKEFLIAECKKAYEAAATPNCREKMLRLRGRPVSKEESALKTVRVWFEKKGYPPRYISHLDLNRCMSRAFHKTKLPLWYTQGFHPHVFLTITMPLSLGMIGLRESMDIRLTEEMAGEEIIRRLNTALASGHPRI